MKRRSFLKASALSTAGVIVSKDLFSKNKGPIYGHNEMKFSLDNKWGDLNPEKTPVNDCHEMIQDVKGRILLLTNETKNNVIIYNKSGRLIDTWGTEFPGAHGLTVQHNGKEDFLFITDTNKHQVYKTTIDGKKILTIDAPSDIAAYKKKEAFVPTETAVLKNGEFYIADGYGAQHILHYDANGSLKNSFGGKGEGDEFFDNAHGICIDYRNPTPTLIITDRTRNAFKRFSLDGKLIEIIHLPGACVCRPVIKGDYLYAAVLRSPSLSNANSGFVTILNKENKVVSNLGGSESVYENNKLNPLSQAEKILSNPHDVCVDDEGSIYVAQWASGKVYPYKFTRV
ncbi:MAG: 6-bladed beta-propeller [Bacteroidetes bacterium]|nr:6-bladed beta-propeller [Bacteroidota bacterium]